MTDMSVLLRAIADHLRQAEKAFLAGRAAEARSYLQDAAASLAAANMHDSANPQVKEMEARTRHLERELAARPGPSRRPVRPAEPPPPAPGQPPVAE